ncbi:MAG: hypothetical protein AAGF31_02060 [Planctomycetota bacterium]
MADLHAGFINDNCVYTPELLSKITGLSVDWWRDKIMHHGIAYRKVGREYFVSGLSIRLWVERGETADVTSEAASA